MPDGEGGNPPIERAPLERPHLAGGEAYVEPTELKGPPLKDDGWRPQPLWEAQQRLRPLIETAIDGIDGLVLSRDQRVVVEARLLPNHLAASQWPGRLFQSAGLVPVGSRPDTTEQPMRNERRPNVATKRVLLSADRTSLERLDEILTGADVDALNRGLDDEISRFDDLALSGPAESLRFGAEEVRTDEAGLLLLDAVLHPQLDTDGQPNSAMVVGVLADWADWVKHLGGSVNSEFVKLDAGMAFTPLVLPPASLNEAARFAQLRVLRPLPTLQEPREVASSSSAFQAPPPRALGGQARIAVFDGGVHAAAPGLDGHVTAHDLTGGTPELAQFAAHGTAVCSAALYGHLDPASRPAPPHTGVDHFRIWPPPREERRDADLMWVLRQIESVVARGEHRIAVIGLAPDQSAADEEPHPWTSVLDRLAVDHDVLFVVAAGNTGELAAGLDRLLVPADAVNGLSVGSCTAQEGKVVRSDYSSVGPGRAGGRTAPVGVQFGGDLATAPFGALLDDGTIGGFEGTSLSAPVVARAAAELDIAINNGASANLLRTLVVHAAERVPTNAANAAGSRATEVGYGRLPATFETALDNDANQVTIVYDGVLKRKEQVTVPFTIPSPVFAQYDTQRFDVRFTLGFLGPVEPANPVDYSCAGLRVVFRPNAERFSLYPPDDEDGAKPITLDRRTDQIQYQALVDRGWTPSGRPESSQKAGYVPEVVQRTRDGKWETLVRMDRRMQGRSLVDPCIDLHMLGREAGTLSDTPDLRWALALTVRGPSGCDIYRETVEYAKQLVPLTTTVPIVSLARA